MSVPLTKYIDVSIFFFYINGCYFSVESTTSLYPFFRQVHTLRKFNLTINGLREKLMKTMIVQRKPININLGNTEETKIILAQVLCYFFSFGINDSTVESFNIRNNFVIM